MLGLADTPVRQLAAALLVALAVLAWVRGTKRFRRGMTTDGTEPLDVVRGFRGWIVAGGLLFIAAGIFFRETWPVLFGLVFLAEELVETGVMILALRRERKSQRATRSSTGTSA